MLLGRTGARNKACFQAPVGFFTSVSLFFMSVAHFAKRLAFLGVRFSSDVYVALRV